MNSLSCIREGWGLNGESCSTVKQQKIKSVSTSAAVLLFWCAPGHAPGLDGPHYQSDFWILPLLPVIEGQAISPVCLVVSSKFIGVFLSLSFDNQERHQALHVLWSRTKDSQHSRLHFAQTRTRWPWLAAMPAYRLSAKAERHLSAAAVDDKEFTAKACVCTVLLTDAYEN